MSFHLGLQILYWTKFAVSVDISDDSAHVNFIAIDTGVCVVQTSLFEQSGMLTAMLLYVLAGVLFATGKLFKFG